MPQDTPDKKSLEERRVKALEEINDRLEEITNCISAVANNLSDLVGKVKIVEPDNESEKTT